MGAPARAPYPYELQTALTTVATGSAAQVGGDSAANKDCVLYQMFFVNTTAGAITITVTGAGAIDVCTTVSIPAKGLFTQVWPDGLPVTGGVTWLASASGLNGHVTGFRKP